jgi:hypothetical protein
MQLQLLLLLLVAVLVVLVVLVVVVVVVVLMLGLEPVPAAGWSHRATGQAPSQCTWTSKVSMAAGLEARLSLSSAGWHHSAVLRNHLVGCACTLLLYHCFRLCTALAL